MSRARTTQAGTAQAHSPVAKALRAFGALLLLTLLAWGAGILQPVVAQTKPAAPAAASTPTATTARAIFAGGCFWCVESDFDKIPGVIATTSGYTGGNTANPSYEQVSGHGTGHAEAVEVVYDPAKVSYERLVEYFWHTIDPTVKDQQFCDRGSPYRTAIFAVGAEQLKIAQASRAALEKTKPFKEPVMTEITPAGAFYPAEDYHQDYYKKNPIRYKYYRSSCGRDARLAQLWGDKAGR
ncbi:MAG: peptide-methionine (S)-S-oxide reductase [Comamonadaceae bacterium PBBC2]|nr:MAG: peptide-methionine (S)-S-oxide reductase [Comamonadaceae bacterium PBBC2]